MLINKYMIFTAYWYKLGVVSEEIQFNVYSHLNGSLYILLLQSVQSPAPVPDSSTGPDRNRLHPDRNQNQSIFIKVEPDRNLNRLYWNRTGTGTGEIFKTWTGPEPDPEFFHRNGSEPDISKWNRVDIPNLWVQARYRDQGHMYGPCRHPARCVG